MVAGGLLRVTLAGRGWDASGRMTTNKTLKKSAFLQYCYYWVPEEDSRAGWFPPTVKINIYKNNISESMCGE